MNNMMIIRILFLLFILIIMPAIVGLTLIKKEEGEGLSSLLFSWIYGSVIYQALFLVIAVPVILKKANYIMLVRSYMIAGACLFVIALFLFVFYRKYKLPDMTFFKGMEKPEKIMYMVVIILISLQVILSIVLASPDGDDAYYTAEAVYETVAGKMYIAIPYTGKALENVNDMSHLLAPFPSWLACLSSITGINATVLIQTIISPFFILMTYSIYYLLSRLLFGNSHRKRALFMLFVQLLVIFGDYSNYTAENFLLLRSRQGKAYLANIIIPFAFLMVFMICKKLEEEQKVPGYLYVGIFATSLGALNASTNSFFLYPLLMGAMGVLIAAVYRKIKPLLACMFSTVPIICMAVIYLWLR